MTAFVLDQRHWRAAQDRRTCRERAVHRKAVAEASCHNRRPTLDEIMSPSFDPWGGAA